MCSNPITHQQQTFACRHCNECIAARINDWIARCMAEKQTSNETTVIGLTYRNNEDGIKPDSAKAFKYKDVQNFLKVLREGYFRKYGRRGDIRYIVAGERGSKKNRVHWHLILFSHMPIGILGDWSDQRKEEIDQMRLDKICHWSMWPHGHVYPQTPDQGGMNYVLKYALKDQFNSVKSKGTMRFSKSEDNAASMFRMSKKPPIAMRWLKQRCDEWEKLGLVPTKLELKIPDYSGFWWPKGDQRKYLVERIYEINKQVREKTGRDAPQWSTLLNSVVKNEKDWEDLFYGPEVKELIEFQIEHWEGDLKVKQDKGARDNRAKQARYRCGGTRICGPCWAGKGKIEKAEYHQWYWQIQDKFNEVSQSRKNDLDGWYREQGQINPFCTLKDTDDRINAFKYT